MMEDDRPIKPDTKYLQQYLQKLNKTQTKQYLKKRQKPQLACLSYKNNMNKQSNNNKISQNKKTKAQIYQKIKKQNYLKFGNKKNQQIKIQQKKLKKINNKNMTINYKSKPIIQIQQYKNKNYISKEKNQQIIIENKQKQNYEKLIEYFNNQLKNLQKQKQQFHKISQKLKFKSSIQSTTGILYTKIKNKVKKLLQTQILSTKQQINKNKQYTTSNIKQSKKQQISNKIQTISKIYSIDDIRNKLSKTSNQLIQLKNKILNNNININQHKYQIFQIHLLPNFQPQIIYQYLDLTKLKYNCNSLYQSAIFNFNSKFQLKQKPSYDNVQDTAQNKIKSNIKQKYIGQTRISKYNGWTQVWIPGKQRLMTNNQNYKIIWLSNGDVLQQFGNQIKGYYNKSKNIYKIQYKNYIPIYYHQPTKQIWRYLQNNIRQIIFQNGRLQLIQNDHQ